MSNRIKTGRLSRRRPPLDHGPLSRPTRDVPPPSTGAGAHFRPARRHVKREQECEPLPAGFCFAQKKRCSLEQTTDSSVELLPPVSWGDAPRNPPPSAKNCLRFEFTKDLKIPPFLPGQVDFDGTLTSDHPRKVTVEKGETLLETRERGTKQWESTISLEVPCMPGPPDTRRDLDLASWKDSSGPTTVSEKVQVSQTSRLLEDHQAVPISHSQARSGPPLQKPDAGAGALPDLASDHLPLQEKLAKGVLDKIHLSSVPAPLVSGKEVQDAKTSHPPSRSCSSSIAPNKKTIKRKLLMPLPLPPPLLLPSLLPWGRNELPPPPKLPRILWEEDLGTSKCKCLKSRKILQGRVDTLKDNVEVLKDKVESLENKVEGLEDKVEALENKLGTPSNNQLGTPSNNLLGTPMNNQLGMPMNNQLGTPINNQLGTPSNNQLGTPSNNQLGFNNNTSGAFFFSTAPPSTFQATTNMPGTGNSNLPTASTSQGPLAFMGPAAPLSGGNFGNNTFAQGPSVISGATDQGGQARGTTSTSRHRNRKSRLQVLLH
ncbi:hypothetical protein TREES_T100013045 [Tupaia chinensis]|uniref:Uncharacterized protein n=1 Tax=Tupaia chinensis TaxID=246437 RepID=L9L0A4_TUPCH|nr:hypothetical protein TREES_T100013045 [Tupaia chinensis]